jgi:hypothetical protein
MQFGVGACMHGVGLLNRSLEANIGLTIIWLGVSILVWLPSSKLRIGSEYEELHILWSTRFDRCFRILNKHAGPLGALV